VNDSRKKILVVCSRVLGNKVLSQMYLDAFSKDDRFQVKECPILEQDYQKHPAPFWKKKLSSTLEAVCVTRQKLRDEVKDGDFKVVFFVGFETALACADLAKRFPSVLVLDTTPALAHGLIRKSESSAGVRLRSALLGGLTSVWCRAVFRRIKAFLPTSEWCAESLVRDCGVETARVTALYPAIDLSEWRVPERRGRDGVSILFVGNDFIRKGGDFLLNLYQRQFKQTCRLTVVSNDPVLKKLDCRDVEVACDVSRTQIGGFFQRADIFVFPSRRDQLPLVVTEAMASALPVVARETGGIVDLVKDGHNGYLISYESGEDEWVTKIQYLVDHPEERARMGANSRKLAEEMFGMEKFERTVREVLEKVSGTYGKSG